MILPRTKLIGGANALVLLDFLDLPDGTFFKLPNSHYLCMKTGDATYFNFASGESYDRSEAYCVHHVEIQEVTISHKPYLSGIGENNES